LRRYTYFYYSVTVGTPFSNVVAINSVLPLHHRCSCTSSNSWPPLRRHCSRLQSQVQTAHHPAPLQPITCVFQYTGAQQQWLRHYQNPLRNPSVHFGSHWHHVEQAQHSPVCICFRSCVQRLRATHAMQHEVQRGVRLIRVVIAGLCCSMFAFCRYSMCDDGIVTISVCKRRHRRSNWKTIASASLPLPNLLSAPFSGDLVLKKRDTDAASVTLAISASIVERFEQPGLLSRMHGKVKSSIARIFQGGERVGPADLGAASARCCLCTLPRFAFCFRAFGALFVCHFASEHPPTTAAADTAARFLHFLRRYPLNFFISIFKIFTHFLNDI
jgi:hypothetical protein